MNNKNFNTITDAELQQINGGIRGALGNALNGLGTWANMMNHGGYVNQWQVFANRGRINQYRPY